MTSLEPLTLRPEPLEDLQHVSHLEPGAIDPVDRGVFAGAFDRRGRAVHSEGLRPPRHAATALSENPPVKQKRSRTRRPRQYEATAGRLSR